MPRKQSSDQAKKSALESEYTPLYAVAGLTDALADALKGALAETQGKASKKINELSGKRPVLEKQAKESADELRTFVITLRSSSSTSRSPPRRGSPSCRSRPTS